MPTRSEQEILRDVHERVDQIHRRRRRLGAGGAALATVLVLVLALGPWTRRVDTVTVEPPAHSGGSSDTVPVPTSIAGVGVTTAIGGTTTTTSSVGSSSTVAVAPTSATDPNLTTPSTDPGTPSPSPCVDGQLGVAPGAPRLPFHAEVFFTVVFTNQSDRPCTIRGWPGVSRRDVQGAQVGVDATRSPADGTHTGDLPPATVLAAGGQASALVRADSGVYYSEADCGPKVTPTSLRVYPPGNTAFVDLPYDVPLCSSGVGEFTVVWVVAGTDGGMP